MAYRSPHIIITCFICFQYVVFAIYVCDIKTALRKYNNGNLHGNIQDWLCLIYEDTEYNETTVKDGRYGVFQIQSPTYCTYGRRGGNCNVDCRDFLDTYLTDDIRCAQLVYDTNRPDTDRDKFNYWSIWRSNCKGKDISIYGSACIP